MGGGQRQSSPQRGKAESEHQNPSAQALYVSLTHSAKNKKRGAEGEGLRRVGRCSPLTPALLLAAAQPPSTHGRGDWGPGCTATALGGRARTRDSPAAPHGLGHLPQHGPPQQDREKSRQQRHRRAIVTSHRGFTLTPARLPAAGGPGLCRGQTSAHLQGEGERRVAVPAVGTWGVRTAGPSGAAGDTPGLGWGHPGARLGTPRGSPGPTSAHAPLRTPKPLWELSPQPCSPPSTPARLRLPRSSRS